MVRIFRFPLWLVEGHTHDVSIDRGTSTVHSVHSSVGGHLDCLGFGCLDDAVTVRAQVP